MKHPNHWDCFNKSFLIEGKSVGKSAPCYIIAEAGVSHFGDLKKAFRLVDAALAAKADAVKFQHFKVNEMISATCPEWVDRMKPKELLIEDFAKIQSYCKERGISFFASAHDEPSLIELSKLNLPCFKVGSGELGNVPYYKRVASFGKPVIVSTGMHTLDDIDLLLRTFKDSNLKALALLHCVTSYPTPPSDCHLRVIEILKERFSGPVGYSDHSVTQDIAAASVLLGAKLIERHITLEKNIPNAQDWKVSCLPEELIEFVASIRRLEAALGPKEFPERTNKEKENILWARKSLVARRDVPAGTLITSDDLEIKRPGTGISPSELSKVIGSKTLVPVSKDTVIKPSMIEQRT